MRVKWTRTALVNLNHAIDYIASDNSQAGKEVAQRIWDIARKLADQPGMGRPGRVPGTRELVVSGLPYILPYVEKNGIIYILRVLHPSMKWPEEM
jgi:toxin ParE1/3/4